MWKVATDGLRIEVSTGAEKISALDGTVIYRPGEVTGERCGNEIAITMDMHGARGQEILTRLRAVPSTTAMISPHLLIIKCADKEHVDAARAVVDELAPARRWPEFVGTRWLSDRMIRIEVSPRTPLTTVNRTFGFDSDVNPVPFHLYYDQEGRKLGKGDLTELGEQLLAAIVEFVKNFGVEFVAVSRICFDFCLPAPCKGEKNRKRVARMIANDLSLMAA